MACRRVTIIIEVGYGPGMDENAGAEIAALREEIAALAERVSVLTAQLHDAASPAVGSDVDAKLARAARLAALRGVDAGRRQPD